MYQLKEEEIDWNSTISPPNYIALKRKEKQFPTCIFLPGDYIVLQSQSVTQQQALILLI